MVRILEMTTILFADKSVPGHSRYSGLGRKARMPGSYLSGLLIGAFLMLLATGKSSAATKTTTTTYVTWINVWNGRDQTHWWNATNYSGARINVRGKWQSIDWADNAQVNEYLDNIKQAGIQVVVADLTNGWGWLDARCQFIQGLCAQKGLRFCVAENSEGNVARFESRARDIWAKFAGPSAPYHETYLQYHGKPLIVCYAIRDWFKAYQNSTGPARSRFNLVWASGEDSDKDKWGWQLEPWVGSIPSTDSMFVTSSIKWNNTDDAWRKSLAWLDYTFALAKQQKPAYTIVGSYDDILERNSWLVADTSGAVPGKQMRDPQGALSTTAYYRRVKEWTSGNLSFVRGGYLRDGAYRIFNRSSEKPARIAQAATAGSYQGTVGAPGAVLEQATPNQARDGALGGVFWIYHLGHHHYRIIALQSGLSLEAASGASGGEKAAGSVRQEWDDNVLAQKWTLERTSRGWYRIKNNATHTVLEPANGPELDGPVVLQAGTHSKRSQQWRFQQVLTLP